MIKFSDIGYLRNSDDAIELELFIAGQVFQKIHINHLICVKEGCMSKRSFNEKYLNATYPENILQNIFRICCIQIFFIETAFTHTSLFHTNEMIYMNFLKNLSRYKKF